MYEKNQVVSYLSVADNGKSSKFWIGLNDVAKEGTYVWDTSTTTATYRFWDSKGPGQKDDEDCVIIDGGTDRFWKESKCSDKNLPLCQKGELQQPV